MKKSKRAVIILLLSLFCAIVAGTVGIIYYTHKYEEQTFACIAMTLRNLFMCFVFAPSLSPGELLDWMNDKKTVLNPASLRTLMTVLTNVYSCVILIAPICMASAIYSFVLSMFRQVKWKLIPLFWKKPKEKIILIGSGKSASDLIQAEIKTGGNREIYYVTTQPKTAVQEEKMLKKKIRLCEWNLMDCTDQEFKEFLKIYKLGTVDRIIICEESDSANFSIYIRLMKFGFQKLSKKSQIYCKCEDSTMMRLITNYYDDNKAKSIPPKLFGIAQMRADAIMEQQDLDISLDEKEISLLIIGFGRTGQRTVWNMMNLAIRNSYSKIQIHVIDKDMNKKEERFLRYLSSEYFTISDGYCAIPSDRADGSFEIFFHKMDARSQKFNHFLEENEFRFTSVCIENVDDCLDCLQMLENYTRRQEDAKMPIVVSLLSEPEITLYLNQETERYENVCFLGTRNYYNIDRIVAASVEEQAKKYHNMYQTISILTMKEYQKRLETEQEKQSSSWEDMLYYKQESSRQLGKHYPVKKKIMKKLKDEKFPWREYFGENGSILQRKKNAFVFEGAVEEMVKKLNADPVLRELGMLEHRRWCYCQAAKGWRYAPKKNELRKETPYLVPWDTLCETYPETCIYDYMAFLLEM